MKVKGMWLDGHPNQQPNDTSRINKNVVATDKFGSISNEKGFEKIVQQQLTQIGVIRLDANDFVVFSTNGILSEITLIENDKARSIMLSQDLNFSLDRPIHGVYFLNNKGERIITWTDRTLRSLNIDSQLMFNVTQLNVFNPVKIPVVSVDTTIGGNLQGGSYQITLQFVSFDGSVSNWIKKYAPVYISSTNSTIDSTGSESGFITNKGLDIRIENLDSNYEKLRVGFIYQNKGVSKFYYVKEIENKSLTTSVHINGSENFVEFPLDEVIIDRSVYKYVDNIASFEQVLLIQGLEEHSEKNQQEKVSNLVFNWHSEQVNLLKPENLVSQSPTYISPENYKQTEFNSRKKSFQHDEVYAIYIQFKWSWGYGKWHICTGRESVVSELVPAQDNSFTNSLTKWKKYQVEDTCSLLSKNTQNATGTFSFWENEDEVYGPEFGTKAGKKVRHFKFPSLNWMKKNVWNDDFYGSNFLDTMGIVPANLNLADFKDENGVAAEGYKLGFAKRENTRVVSQTLLSPNYLVDNSQISLGGNWLYSPTVQASVTNSYRTWPFDLLRSKKEIFVNYARIEWQLNAILNMYVGYDPANNSGEIYPLILSDFTRVDAKVKQYDLLEVNSTQYIPANSLTKDFNNVYLEEFLNVNFLKQPPVNLTVPFDLKNTTIGTFSLTGISEENRPSIIYLQSVNRDVVEQSGLLTLLNIQRNYYVNYYSQTVVNCGSPVANVYYGDTFLCDSSVNAYGIVFKKYTNDETAWKQNVATFNYKKNGIRAVKRYLFQSQYNANLRYVNNNFSLQTSFYSSNNKISSTQPYGKIGYANAIQTDVNPNDFINGYDEDKHSLNEIEFSEIAYKLNEQKKFPFRIAQSEPLNNELEVNSWRDFKPNNYYDLIREKGKVINMVSADDFLYIHFRNALYRTKPRGILQPVEGSSIQLGYGNLFQFDPVPVTHTELGEMGTQHKWSCLLTKYGYIFFDSDKGIWFSVGSDIEAISNRGLNGFFRDNKYCPNDNPFFSEGVFASYDEAFNRLLVTKKNKKLKPEYQRRFKGVWKDNAQFEASLKSGDLVLKDGRWQQVV